MAIWPNPLCNKLSVYTREPTEWIITAGTSTTGTSGTIITSSGSNPSVW